MSTRSKREKVYTTENILFLQIMSQVQMILITARSWQGQFKMACMGKICKTKHDGTPVICCVSSGNGGRYIFHSKLIAIFQCCPHVLLIAVTVYLLELHVPSD